MKTHSKDKMKSGSRMIPLLTACVIVVGSGVIHGLIIDRWGSSDVVNHAAASLKQVPSEFGDWKSEESSTISARELEIGEIDGYLSRVYTNQTDGSKVSMMIVCGRPGPISVHTPDICFRGAGYQIVSGYERHRIASEQKTNPTADAFFADFTKPTSEMTPNLRVFWTWSDGRLFTAPDNPRVAFAGKPFLYKIYLTRSVERLGDPPETDQCASFLKFALPVLQQSLFSEETSDI